MDYRTDLGLVRFGSMEGVIDRQKMLPGEFVHPLHQDGLLAPCFERGAGAGTRIPPECCWRDIAVDLCRKLSHGNAVERYVQPRMSRTWPQAGLWHDCGNRQLIHVPRQRVCIEQGDSSLHGSVRVMTRVSVGGRGGRGKQAHVPQEFPSGGPHRYFIFNAIVNADSYCDVQHELGLRRCTCDSSATIAQGYPYDAILDFG